MTKIPVIGPPPHWKWFPDPLAGYYETSEVWTAYARREWFSRFTHRHKQQPKVYWSRRIGAHSDVHARTYDWGIVLSWRNVKGRTLHWKEALIRHELLHWAGYGHDRRFREAAKRLGTW